MIIWQVEQSSKCPWGIFSADRFANFHFTIFSLSAKVFHGIIPIHNHWVNQFTLHTRMIVYFPIPTRIRNFMDEPILMTPKALKDHIIDFTFEIDLRFLIWQAHIFCLKWHLSFLTSWELSREIHPLGKGFHLLSENLTSDYCTPVFVKSSSKVFLS